MKRRSVLKGAGALAAVAVTGGLHTHAESVPDPERPRGLARGLTVLNIRRNGAYALAVKTDKGILIVPEAAKSLRVHAPADVDELLQNEDGPLLNSLVDAALKSNSAHSAFVKEEGIGYGPVVTRPEKIVCIGLNYRKHAQETGQPVPKKPILFNKYNTALNNHNDSFHLPQQGATKIYTQIKR